MMGNKVMRIKITRVLLSLFLPLLLWLGFHQTHPPTVTLVAVGDVLLSRGVGRQIEKHGPHYPFKKMQKLTSLADIAFCNLECPISKGGFPRKTQFLFRADPQAVEGLSYAGFDIASLANNHTLDYGRDALLDTMSHLSKADIKPSGAGTSRSEAVKPAVIIKKGLKVGFLSYTDLPAQGDTPLPDKPGIARVDPGTLTGEVKGAEKDIDVLVVSFHWGVEYKSAPTERQKELAHKAIDAGADLVLGHHPHVLQPVEIYKNKPIIYSMGSFVFDVRPWPSTRRSQVYTFELNPGKARLVKKTPIKIVNCQPVLDDKP
jgi:poly-gamma-glutamate synthesis protein (capsule biosynthesis protein)